MRSKKDIRTLLEDLLLERGVQLTKAEGIEEFVDELDGLIDELITVRLAMGMVEGTCGSSDCPVHGTNRRPTVDDPNMN